MQTQHLAVSFLALLSAPVVTAQAIELAEVPDGKALKISVTANSTVTSERSLGGRGGRGGAPQETELQLVFVDGESEAGHLRRYEVAESIRRGRSGKLKTESELVGKDLIFTDGDEGVVITEGPDGAALSDKQKEGLPESVDLSGLLPKVEGELEKGTAVVFDVAAFRSAMAALSHPIRPASDESTDDEPEASGDRSDRRRRGRRGRRAVGGARNRAASLAQSPIAVLLANEAVRGDLIGKVVKIRERSGERVVTFEMVGELSGSGEEVSRAASFRRRFQNGGGGGRDLSEMDVDADASMTFEGQLVVNVTAGRIVAFEVTGKSEQVESVAFDDREFSSRTTAELVVKVNCEICDAKLTRRAKKN